MEPNQIKDLIEDYVKRNLYRNRSGDLYVNIALQLYRYDPAHNPDVAKIIRQQLPSEMAPVPHSLIKTLQLDKRSAIGWCLNSGRHDLLELPYSYRTRSNVAKICARLADVQAGERVWLPFSGLNEMARFLPEGAKISGEEINKTIWALGQINLWAYDVSADIAKGVDSYKAVGKMHPDSIDVILADLPANDPDHKMGEFLERCLYPLSNNGRIYVIIRRIFLHFRCYRYARKKILGNINRVILLPDIHFRAFAIVCLSKVPTTQITFVDGSEAETNGMIDHRAFNAILTDETSPKRITIDKASIDLDECNLDPSKYLTADLAKEFPDCRLYQLRDLIDFVSGERLARDEKPALGSSDLSLDYLNCTIDKNSHLTHDQGRYKYRQKVLLMALHSLGFAIGRFEPSADMPDLKASASIRAFEIKPAVKDHIVDEDYLLRVLSNGTMSGQIFTRLSPENWPNLHIPLPPLEDQRRIVTSETRQHLNAIRHLVDKSQQEMSDRMRSLRHLLGNDLGKLGQRVDILGKSWGKVKSRVTDDDPAMYNLIMNVSKIVEDQIKGIETLHASMSEICDKMRNVSLDISGDIDLDKFFKDYLDRRDMREYVPLISLLPPEDQDGLKVRMPKESLYMIFNNIINNIVFHGFDNNPNPSRHRIRIKWSIYGNSVVIDILNNGSPLTVTPEQAMTLGFSTKRDRDSHSGEGCSDIKRMMEQYDGSFSLISTPNDEYKITYRLTFNK